LSGSADRFVTGWTGVVYALLGAGWLIVLGFMIHAGRPRSPEWFAGSIPWALWAAAPFGAGALLCRWVRSSARALAILAIAAVLLAGGTAALLYDAFVAHPDAQSAVLFVFLPFWQSLALAPFAIAALWTTRRGSAS
jgi:hypothetical protein